MNYKQKKLQYFQVGMTPLPDNDLKDKYLYEVIVNTGSRKGAGTDSKVNNTWRQVHLILSWNGNNIKQNDEGMLQCST